VSGADDGFFSIGGNVQSNERDSPNLGRLPSNSDLLDIDDAVEAVEIDLPPRSRSFPRPRRASKPRRLGSTREVLLAILAHLG
jgi:hypothetical protein